MFSFMKRPHFYILCFLFISIFFSCTVKQDVTLNQNGSGAVSIKLTLHEGFYNYLKTLAKDAAEISRKPEEKLFKLEVIREQLVKIPGITVQKLTSLTPRSLEMELTFSDINLLIKESKTAPASPAIKKIFSLTQDGNKYRFILNLSPETYRQLTPMIPVTENPLYEVLGPHPEDPITEDEYYDLVEFTIGEGASQLVKKSNIETTIKVQGKIVSQQGGTIIPNGVSFNIPLIKFLVLNQPIQYSFEFTK
jgi:hypothetical protein